MTEEQFSRLVNAIENIDFNLGRAADALEGLNERLDAMTFKPTKIGGDDD